MKFNPIRTLGGRWPFRLLVVFAILLAWLLFCIAIPPFQNVDEPGHYAYVQSISHGRLPALFPVPGQSDVETSILDHFQSKPISDAGVYNMPLDTNISGSDYVDTSVQGYEPPLYYAVGALIYMPARAIGFSPVALMYITKGTSLLFFLIFLASFWKVIKSLWNETAANYLTLAIALQPTLLMAAVSINPEIAPVALLTLGLAILVEGLRKADDAAAESPKADGTPAASPFFRKYLPLLILVSAAAIFSKFNGIILMPVVVLALLLKPGFSERRRAIITYVAASAGILILYFLFNYLRFRNFMPHNVDFVTPIDRQAVPSTMGLLWSIIWDFKAGLLAVPGFFGYAYASMFYELRVLYLAIVFLFLSAGVYFTFRGRRFLRSLRHEYVNISMAAALVLMMLFNVAYSLKLKEVSYSRWLGVMQGRYFLIGVLPAAALFFLGMVRLLKVKRAENVAKLLFVLSLFFFLISLLYIVIPRYYV